MNDSAGARLLQQAQDSIRQGQTDEAMLALEAACAREPHDVDLILAAVELSNGIGDAARSLALLETVAAGNPDNPALLLRLGTAYLQAGRRDDACHTHGRAYALQPENQEIVTTYANTLTYSGNVSAAIDVYERALQDNPDNKGTWMSLASLQQMSGNHEGWMNAYLQAHRLDPGSAYIAAMLSDALLKAGRHAEALAVVERTLAADPGNRELKLRKATIQERKGAFDDAFDSLRELIDTESVTLHAALIFVKISPFIGLVNEARELITYIIRRDRLDPLPKGVQQALAWLDRI